MKSFKTTAAILAMLALFLSGGEKLIPSWTARAKTLDSRVEALTIPQHAIEVAPDVFFLGKAKDVDGRTVEGYLLIHPKRAQSHKPNHDRGSAASGGSSCYAYLGKGAKWKNTESYLINSANGDGLSGSFVTDTFATGLEEWDKQVAFEIFGNGSTTNAVLSADNSSPDGQNEVYFGSFVNPSTIAATTIWGIFSGPIGGRKLTEWDMVFNDPDYAWGDATVNPSVMDFNNIAVHEDGHAAGMAHPSDLCAEETMYRFANSGETKKRDLNTGDITGIKGLYR